MRFEDPQGDGDDTAANGLRWKFCKMYDWHNQVQKTFEGIWGDWKGMVMCPENQYVAGFQVRIEPKQGNGDDTAMNGLKLFCRSPNGRANYTIKVYEGVWGDWSEWRIVS